jgi:ubiquinol-cytochrome c reductase cytochrome c1 subunit
MSKGRIVLVLATIIVGLAAVSIVAANPVAHSTVHTQSWSFTGIFGHFDHAQLRRGYQVYKDVCAGCHAMDLVAYRDLQDIGFTEEEVQAFAAEVEVQDGPDDTGEMFERPGTTAPILPTCR